MRSTVSSATNEPPVDVVAGIAMVTVPGGRVGLTDRRTQRSWSVDVAPFRLGRTPVTWRQYAEVTGTDVGKAGIADRPVIDITWWDAVRFCNSLSRLAGLDPGYVVDEGAEHVEHCAEANGYRLPSEAQWEHACRAGTTGPRYGELDDIAWYRGNSGESSHAVGTKQPNPWGLFDMLGNVWEWTWDRYDPEVYGTYRVLRGGGWYDPHWSVRASVRRRSHPTLRIDDVGLRVARACGGYSATSKSAESSYSSTTSSSMR